MVGVNSCYDYYDYILVSMKVGYMDKFNQAISSEKGHSSNKEGLSMSKKERVIAHILATKFHTEPATDPELEVRLNPIMNDLIINIWAMKKKERKRQKTETITKMAKSIEENQLNFDIKKKNKSSPEH